MGKIKRGKGTNLMAMADGSGLPLAANTTSASPHEVTLVGQTLDGKFVAEMPQRFIGDRAYDSDGLDEALADQGIEMIAPHKRGRKKTQEPKAVQTQVEDREVVCVAGQLPQTGGSL